MKRLLLIVLLLVAIPAFAMEAQKISELRISEPIGQFLLKLPSSAEAQIVYGWSIAVIIGMLSSWFGKWKLGQANGRYFIDNYQWTIGSLVGAVSVGLGGIATGTFETSSGEFIGWWSVMYHGGVAGAAIDWAANKGSSK